jgi:uncharacterized membrane protein YcaP (DUF421 family)
MFFDRWYDILRVLVVGLLGYSALVLIIRVAGKRTLSTLNAFDLIVTVALGSTLASILLSSDVSYSEGLLAFTVLIGAQLVVALLSTRWSLARRAIKSEPALLLRDGQMQTDALRRQRVTEGEVRQAIRATGGGDVNDIAAVVLETDGKFSVISREQLGSASALFDVADSWEQAER